MAAAAQESFRAGVEARTAAGEPCTADDVAGLLATDDLSWLGGLAHARRTAASGAVTTFLPVSDVTAVDAVLAWQYDSVTDLPALDTDGYRVVAPVRVAGPDGHEVSPAQMLKLFAVLRLVLPDTVTLACDLASHPESTGQLLLDFGVAELLVPADGFDPQHVAELIWDAGGTPVHRDADFGTVRDYGPATPAAQRRAEPQSVFS